MLGKQGQAICKHTVPQEWADVLFDRVFEFEASDVVDGEFSEDEVLQCSRANGVGAHEKPSPDDASPKSVSKRGQR